MIMVRIGDSGKPEIADFQVTRSVQQQIARLQISMEYIRRMDVFQTSQDLIEEVADVVVRQPLGFQEFIQIRFHQTLQDRHKR